MYREASWSLPQLPDINGKTAGKRKQAGGIVVTTWHMTNPHAVPKGARFHVEGKPPAGFSE